MQPTQPLGRPSFDRIKTDQSLSGQDFKQVDERPQVQFLTPVVIKKTLENAEKAAKNMIRWFGVIGHSEESAIGIRNVLKHIEEKGATPENVRAGLLALNKFGDGIYKQLLKYLPKEAHGAINTMITRLKNEGGITSK